MQCILKSWVPIFLGTILKVASACNSSMLFSKTAPISSGQAKIILLLPRASVTLPLNIELLQHENLGNGSLSNNEASSFNDVGICGNEERLACRIILSAVFQVYKAAATLCLKINSFLMIN